MIRAARHSSGLLRRVCLTLAMLGVALKIVAPPGFMIAPESFPLVLCTAQGAITVDMSGHDEAPASKADHVPCVFAGHAAAPPPSLLSPAPAAFAVYAEASRPLADLAPGRGLVAPPPPARGPPQLV